MKMKRIIAFNLLLFIITFSFIPQVKPVYADGTGEKPVDTGLVETRVYTSVIRTAEGGIEVKLDQVTIDEGKLNFTIIAKGDILEQTNFTLFQEENYINGELTSGGGGGGMEKPEDGKTVYTYHFIYDFPDILPDSKISHFRMIFDDPAISFDYLDENNNLQNWTGRIENPWIFEFHGSGPAFTKDAETD